MRVPSILRPPSLAPLAQRSSPSGSLLSRLLALPKARPRVAHLAGEIALVELRGLPLEALADFERALLAEALLTAGVQSAEVNPHLRRVRFRITPGRVPLATLTELVERAEAACAGIAPAGNGASQLSPERELPDDELLRIQRWVELVADSAGLGAGVLLRVVPFVPSVLATNLAAVLLLVRSHPRLRAPLDRKLGRDRTDLLLSLVLAGTQGVSRRPLSSLIDVGYRVSALREHRARARLYERRRADLFAEPAASDLRAESLRIERPVPAPKGPLEQYDGRAWFAAAGAFGVGLLTSRSVRRAGAALLGALPKPAYLGREIYANEVSRALSQRGTLVLAPDALRRLDRVDCLVIDASLLSHARFSVAGISVQADYDPSVINARVHALFDPRRPTELQVGDGYQLGPLPLLRAHADGETAAAARELSERGSLVLGLGLAGEDELCALVEIRIGGRRGVEDLVDSAQRGGLHVVVAEERGTAWTYLGSHPVEVMAGGADLPDGIRRLQQRGHMVLYVGLGPAPGLAHADCAVGVRDPDAPPPWAAHVICEPDLDGLHTLVRACLLARSVSKQSVNLALGAAALGALASAGGKGGPSQRVMLVVNVAALVAMLNALRQSAPLRGRELTALPDPTPWHALDARGVLARVRSGPAGLDDQDVATRLSDAQLRAREPSALAGLSTAIAEELLNPLAPLLAAGAGLSALVGSTLDAGIVAGVGGINAVVGGVQRFRTERAIRRLVRPVRQQVRVRRSGATRLLPAEELVAGDIVLMRPGENVPADCRILEHNALEVDTSILTGESLPSARDAAPSFEQHLADRSCMLYAGTRVVAGSATAVVVAVGDQVEARRHGQAKDLIGAQSGVEARLRELMALTGPVATAGGIAVVTAGLLRGRSAGDLVETGVSMAVAAIPEGLPLLANAAQLAAAERLSRRGALVRNARSIEALGRVDVICLDKTGTLTEGRLELHTISGAVHGVRLHELGPTEREVLAAGLRASAIAGAIHAEPTDAALQRAASQVGVDRADGTPGLRPHSEHPFESARGYHAVLARTDAGLLLSVKGMPERVLPRCRELQIDGARIALSPETRDALLVRATELAAQGLRVLCVAERELDPSVLRASLPPGADDAQSRTLLGSESLCFYGFLAFRDATRPEAARTLERLRQAGIEVVMLTGDHISTATTIAHEIDLLRGREVMTGGAIGYLSDEELEQRIERCGVFARVTPGQKVRIVRALQRRGHVVAMVGDGANDAPAMRVAEVGVAVGQQCAPSARAVADIVLAEAAIERLLDCILEARAMWLSVRDAVSILVGGNLGEIGFTVVGGLIAGRPPLSPRQLLLVNFLTDIAPAMAIALRKPPEEAYERLLHGRPEELLRSRLSRAIAIRALSTGLGASWAWGLGRLTGGKKRASTMALAALVGSQLGQTMLSRESGKRVMVTALGSAGVLAILVQTPGLSHLFGCRPLGPLGWAGAIGSSAAATATSALLAAVDEKVEAFVSARAEPIRAVVQRANDARERLAEQLESLGKPVSG
jgi:magnesium-transporting ATPase (P-type)